MIPATIEIEKVGNAVFLKSGSKDMSCNPNLRGGKRGKITEFSWKSNKRFCDFLVSIDHEKTIQKHGGASWVTLTFDGKETGADEAKIHLNYLLSKLLPRNGWNGPAIWKAELQKRKTIHFHVLLYEKCTDALGAFIAAEWHRITGSRQRAHLEHGTDCVACSNIRIIRCYLAKYLTKETGSAAKWNLGRVWGKYRSDQLVWEDRVDKTLVMPLGRTGSVFKGMGITLPRAIYNLDEWLEYCDQQFATERPERVSYWKWRKLEKLKRKRAAKSVNVNPLCELI